MGDQKSGASSGAAGNTSIKPAKELVERPEASQRSQSDPGATAAMTDFDKSQSMLNATKERRPSKDSLADTPIDDDDDDADADNAVDDDENETYDEDEEPRPTIQKRHSASAHTNVYTECGRHGDDWLFGSISGAVKSVFGKNEKK